MKRCFKCGVEKPLSEFYKHKEMSDGHLNKCKECAKTDVKLNMKAREVYYKAYDRVRSKEGERKRKHNERSRAANHKESVRESKRLSSQKWRKRKAATTALNNAVRDGRISKLPCFICGCLDVQGHHPDYSRPLDVIWLCVKHHAEIHREYDFEEDKKILETTVKGSYWDLFKSSKTDGK